VTSSHLTSSSEALYALSWKRAQDGKIAFDAVNTTVIDANPAMEELMGRPRDELIGMTATELHPQDERERVLAVMGIVHDGTTLHTGFHIQRKGVK
jgi:PAS domain S-box-containing protein